MTRRGKVIRFPTRPPEPRDSRSLVAVHRCDRAEAVVVKSLFESEGIPTLLRSHLAHSVHPFSVGDQGEVVILVPEAEAPRRDRKSTRLNSSHLVISYAVFCLKKKKHMKITTVRIIPHSSES